MRDIQLPSRFYSEMKTITNKSGAQIHAAQGGSSRCDARVALAAGELSCGFDANRVRNCLRQYQSERGASTTLAPMALAP